MQLRKCGQPGKYVRLKGVDVHANADRPSGANPANGNGHQWSVDPTAWYRSCNTIIWNCNWLRDSMY